MFAKAVSARFKIDIFTASSRKHSASVSEGFLFQKVRFTLHKVGRCCGAFQFALEQRKRLCISAKPLF